ANGRFSNREAPKWDYQPESCICPSYFCGVCTARWISVFPGHSWFTSAEDMMSSLYRPTACKRLLDMKRQPNWRFRADSRQTRSNPVSSDLPVTRAQSQRASLKRLWRGHFDEYPTPAMISAHIRLNRLPLTSRPSVVLRAKHGMVHLLRSSKAPQ